MKDIVIIGAGGVGREAAWIIEQINERKSTWNILGFIDDNKYIWDTTIDGYKILGGIDYLMSYVEQLEKNRIIEPLYVVIAIANYKVKKSIIEKLDNKFKFATIIHPEVYIHNSNSIGEGNIIYPGVVMTTNITVGNQVIISPKCGIGHDTVIKDYVSLLWNVNVSGVDVIEEGVLMGSGATVIQSKTIGKGAVIGAGAVVIKDVEGERISVGVPAVCIK